MRHFDFFGTIEMILLQYCSVLKSEQRWRPLLQITNQKLSRDNMDSKMKSYQLKTSGNL